ncbi:glycosyltransferase involved in cell wall biosynthesis [Lachnospiraceae bacterium PF1-22]|uniref:glycosyltransferase family 2 protein n=1 Tax=Ohessyouella blattaphilus TaxID=2949333 RepID=UPI003E1AD077
MTVSFCVIAYNEEKFLENLFMDIRKQDYPHELMEVVFVNAMSTDNTKKMMLNFAAEDNGFIRVIVRDNLKRRQSAGWNVAITSAKEDIILRIDAHTKIPSDFVSKSVCAIERGESIVGGARPNIVDEDTPWKRTLLLAEGSMFGSGIAPFRSSQNESYVKSVFHGAYRREVFKKAGLFNENLGRTEDNEMHFRIRKSGYKIYYDPRIVSYQHIRPTLCDMLKQKFGNGLWIGLTMGVCPQCFSWYHFVPMTFVLAMIATFIMFCFENRLFFLMLIFLYFLVDLLMSLVAAKCKKKYWQYLLLPIIFPLLHVSYGLGTLIGVVRMPFWKKRIET